MAACQDYDHGVGTLEFAKPPADLGVIGEFIVGELPAGCDIRPHGLLLSLIFPPIYVLYVVSIVSPAVPEFDARWPQATLSRIHSTPVGRR
jgi:hypothetical protein